LQVWLLALTIPSLAPATVSYRSPHFVVEAPTAEIAARIARGAETNLRDLSQKWLAREPAEWGEPCQISVSLGSENNRGSSTFVFREGRVVRQEMHLEGNLERILDGVLPHEMTHVVLTGYFGRPFPRWADEGGATLAEGELQTTQYREQMRRLLATPSRCIPLRELFGLEHYPRDAFAFYETGFSISRYLVGLKGRREFVAFVTAGMDGDWNDAVRHSYGFETVEELQTAWLESVRKEKEPNRHEILATPTARTAGGRPAAPGESTR
jgi:hypothetical protein